jgi:hypothetical protein
LLLLLLFRVLPAYLTLPYQAPLCGSVPSFLLNASDLDFLS